NRGNASRNASNPSARPSLSPLRAIAIPRGDASIANEDSNPLDPVASIASQVFHARAREAAAKPSSSHTLQSKGESLLESPSNFTQRQNASTATAEGCQVAARTASIAVLAMLQKSLAEYANSNPARASINASSYLP